MELKIEAQPRETFGKQNRKLRKTGMLPAVLYGRGKESVPLAVNARDFEKVYRQAGESTLVNLALDGKAQKKVLIHEVAKHFMSDEPIHVDFYEVDLTRKLHTKVPLHFVGTSPAVKELGGILLKNFNELEIEALPADLPPFLEVSIDKLLTFEDLLRVKELKVASAIKILHNLDDVVVSVQPPRSEEELAELEKPTVEAEKAAVEQLAKEEVKEGEETKTPEEEKKEKVETKEGTKEEK